MSSALALDIGPEDRRIAAFSLREAASFGRDAAIFLDRLRYWVKKNLKAGRNQRDGRTWSFSTQDEIASYIGISARQFRRLVKQLRDDGLIMVRQLHDDTRNRTNWYAFVDEETALAGPIPLPARPSHEDSLSICSIRTPEKEAETEPPQRLEGAVLAMVIPLSLKEAPSVSDETKSRNDAFKAVRGDTSPRESVAPARDRGDLARRRARDDYAGKPRKTKQGASAPRPARAAPQSPVFDAWRTAMNAKGIPTVQAPERRDVEDGNRIIEKAGSEELAVAYVKWTVENWGTLAKKFPKLDDYGMTFGTISGGWMRSLFPLSATATAGPKPIEGSEFFLAYMAKTEEEKVAMNPQDHQRSFQNYPEFSQALKAYMAAKSGINRRRVQGGN